ncbi:50S ribosomal protein L7/L12 [Erysipelothrix inopinata]|uniref:Large ribosomal subunit protein bL12 n=1 Tax=Erysipelothrix inopinata TaxID=225084 RepID=A0A7G9RZT9_9FIRM|nr:50S ribosomal protein L7/L12 [Erysipelothrix inopinata]QNN61114.1 50S ribosomal protein L7/L12 [Erysipelothrix inopinata]
MAKLTAEELIASLKEMTILELNELVKAIEEEFGVSAAAPVAVAAAADSAEAEGPSEVSVILKEVSGSKVGVIKALRDITGLGMMEAKALVDNAPSPIKENIKPAEAEELKAKLVEAGAVVEVK